MKLAYSLALVALCVGTLCAQIQPDFITLYSNGAALTYNLVSEPLKPLSIWGLPKGLVDSSLLVNGAKQWSFQPLRNDMLEQWIGKKVGLIQDKQKIEGILRATQSGVVFQVDNTLRVNPQGEWVLPLNEVPQLGLLSLIPNAPSVSIQAITEALKAQLVYTLQWDSAKKLLNLRSELDIDNQTDQDFTPKKLQFHRVPLNLPQHEIMASMRFKTASMSDQQPKEGAQIEGNAYVMDVPSTVLKRGKTRITVQKDITLPGIPFVEYKTSQPFASLGAKVNYTQNTPLGAGLASVYFDSNLTGFQPFKPIVKGQFFVVQLGPLYSLKGKRDVVSTTRISDKAWSNTVKITLENSGSEKVALEVIDYLPPQAQITNSSKPYTRKEANTLSWTIEINSYSSLEIVYTFTN